MSRPALGLVLLAGLGLLSACARIGANEARGLVEHYNQAVCEAYRRGDVRLIDPVVAPDSVAGRRLTGLIGVRLDLGITLDAHLQELQVVAVESGRDGLQIRTRERWRYRDLRMGSGEQVGEASEDRYELLYLFRKIDGAWLVTETKFTAPPQVGRRATPWRMDARDAHAMIGPAPAQEGKK